MSLSRAVVGIITRITNQGETEYLFIKPQHRDLYNEHAQKYFPPSGHLEEGESDEQGLIREIQEELGVEVVVTKKVTEMPSDLPGDTLVWMECKLLSDQITPQESEIADYKWFTVEQIKQLDLWPATDKFFKEYIYGR